MTPPKSVLLIKTSALGDIVHTYPVVAYLKSRFPNIKIDWAVEQAGASLVQNHPDIHQAHICQFKKWKKKPFDQETKKEFKTFRRNLRSTKYDYVFDLQGNTKSALITWLSQSKNKVGFSYRATSECLNCFATHHRFTPPPGQNIRYDYLSIVQQALNDDSTFEIPFVTLTRDEDEKIPLRHKKKSILICPGANWSNKQIPLSSWLDLLENQQQKDHSALYLAWGSEDEKKICKEIQKSFPNHSTLLPKLSFPALQNFMASCDLVIAMDSFPLHLASTTPVSTWSFFGPSSEKKYRPIGPHHKSIQGPCPYGQTFEKRCKYLRTCSTGTCIKNITSKNIIF